MLFFPAPTVTTDSGTHAGAESALGGEQKNNSSAGIPGDSDSPRSSVRSEGSNSEEKIEFERLHGLN